MSLNTAFSSKQKHAITSLALSLALRMFGVSLFMPVLTLYAKELTSNGLLIGLAFGIYGLVQAVLQIPVGILSDSLGRKKIIVFGLLIYLIGSIIAAETSNIYLLIFARALQGAGAISGAVYAYIADIVEREKRNRAMAFLGMPFGMAFGFGIILGPVLGAMWGIPSLFWFCAGLVGIAMVYVAITLDEQPTKTPEKLPFNLFIKDAMAVITNGRLLRINLGGFITNFFMTGTFMVLPILLKQFKDMKDFWQIIIPMVIFGTLIMIWAAKKGDGGKSRTMAALAHVLLAFSSLVYLLPFFHSLIVASVMFFAGFSMLQPILSAGVTTFAEPEKVGGTSGLYNMSQFIGTFFGGFIGGMFVQSINLFLLLLAALGFIGAIFVSQAFSGLPEEFKKKESRNSKEVLKSTNLSSASLDLSEVLKSTGTFQRTNPDQGL